MAQYTYTEIKDSKIPSEGDTVMLYHRQHSVQKGSGGYYLSDSGGENDWIFGHLGIRNKKEFCGVSESNTGTFPWISSLEELRDVIKKLWDYMPLKVGDKVRVRKDIAEGDGYPISVVHDMVINAGKLIPVDGVFEEIVITDDSNKYGVYRDILSGPFYYSLDTLDLTDIEKGPCLISPKESTIPYKIDGPISTEDIFAQSSGALHLPKVTKSFKIQL